eukprot:scaffold12825_cov164-Amphora_coffeaeformis.AAC.2
MPCDVVSRANGRIVPCSFVLARLFRYAPRALKTQQWRYCCYCYCCCLSVLPPESVVVLARQTVANFDIDASEKSRPFYGYLTLPTSIYIYFKISKKKTTHHHHEERTLLLLSSGQGVVIPTILFSWPSVGTTPVPQITIKHSHYYTYNNPTTTTTFIAPKDDWPPRRMFQRGHRRVVQDAQPSRQ